MTTLAQESIMIKKCYLLILLVQFNQFPKTVILNVELLKVLFYWVEGKLWSLHKEALPNFASLYIVS